MDRLRTSIQALFLTIALVVSYELKIAISWDTPLRILLIAIISYILSEVLAGILTKTLLKWRFIRKISLGRLWVEGYWYIETYEAGNQRPIAKGLLSLSYFGENLSLSVSSYKLRSPESTLETVSRSEFAYLNPSNLAYFNYFNYTVDTDFIHGIALGHFSREEEKGHPIRYDGKLYFFSSDKPEYRQIALKIPDREIISLQKKHGDMWRKVYLAQKNE